MSLATRASTDPRAFRRAGVTACLLIIAATLSLSVLPAVAVVRTPYNTNLVKNPGFEAGAATNGYSWVQVPDWFSEPNGTVVAYGTAGGFPTAAEGNRISGGNQFYTSGTPSNDICAYAQQDITVRGRANAIDSGHVKVVVSARAGTYGSQTDTTRMKILFRDTGGSILGTLTMPSKTATNGQLQLISGKRVAPAGTRNITILLDAINTELYCDAYFDNIKVKLVNI